MYHTAIVLVDSLKSTFTCGASILRLLDFRLFVPPFHGLQHPLSMEALLHVIVTINKHFHPQLIVVCKIIYVSRCRN